MRTAPVEHVVRSKTRAEMAKTPEVWKAYNDLARTIRIVNRAAKGPCAGKPFSAAVNGEAWPDGANGDDDDLFNEAIAVVLEAKKASASLLQRRLKVGYARAARLLDLMEAADLIGPGEGAKPRDVNAEKIEQRLA